MQAERKRVEAVVETLAAIHNHGESLAELAHDASNMVTALRSIATCWRSRAF